MEPSYLCLLYVATAGQRGRNLGADQTEIVLLIYVMIDVQKNKVVGWMQKRVKPNVDDINQGILSKQVLKKSTLTEKFVRAGVPLQTAIAHFEEYRKKFQIGPFNPTLHFVTDGQLHLRQCLYPEACRKGIELPYQYAFFHDLRKEFKACYGVQDEPYSIGDMLRRLGITPTPKSESVFFFKEVEDMVIIAKRLIADGHKFTSPETINLGLELGIYLRNEEVDDSCVVIVKGLPWFCLPKEVAKFFSGLNVAKGGVTKCQDPYGRKNGIAFVRFENPEQRDMALRRHLHQFCHRYIEVYEATGKDFISHAGGNNSVAQAFLSRGGQEIVQLRGLPYDFTAKQVVDFLEAGEDSCKVMNGEDGVLLVKNPDGETTGLAFVLFAQEEDAIKAFRKHNSLIGPHYVDVFRSTPENLQQVLNSVMYSNNEGNTSQRVQTHELPLSQHIRTFGATYDAILICGIPFKANINAVIKFLGEHARYVASPGIQLSYNVCGHPKEAIVQMDSEQSAFLAAQALDFQFMLVRNNYWCVRVYQLGH